MIRIIRKWLGLCNHHWRVKDQYEIRMALFEPSPTGQPNRILYVMQCDKCGKLHNHRT